MENKEAAIGGNAKVRISPRISRRTRALAKAVYPLMGVTLEDRIEHLLLKDLDREMKKAWFKDLLQEQVFFSDDSGRAGDWREEGL